MGNPSPRYTAEFKQKAVELYRKSGTTYAEVARGLGCDAGSLADWVKKADEAERLVRPIELEQPPVPSVHAREVVDVDRGVLRPVLLVEPRHRLGDFLGHQLLHVFLRSGHVALNISPLRAKPNGDAARRRRLCSLQSRTGAKTGQGSP